MTQEIIIHDPYSASKAARWINCPGSVRRCEGVDEPKSQDTTARDMGTILHGVCEILVRIGSPVVDAVEARTGFEPDPFGDLHQQYLELQSRTSEVLDSWDAILLKACRMWRKAMAAIEGVLEPGWTCAPEYSVDLSMLGIGLPGYIDILAIGTAKSGSDIRVVVVDFKGGMVRVDAENNPQMACYSIGAAEESGADDAVAVIIQPTDEDGESIATRSWYLSRQVLSEWTITIQEARRKAEWSDQLTPGEWCGYCPTRLTCEARRSILSMPIEVPSLAAHLEQMNQDQRGEFLSRLSQAKKWTEAAWDETKLLLQTTGLEATGWGFKKGAEIRVWSDPSAAKAELLALCATAGIPEEVVIDSKLKSPKTMTDEGILDLEIFSHLIGKKSNAPSLSPMKAEKKASKKIQPATTGE
jgi:hypothetical protein